MSESSESGKAAARHGKVSTFEDLRIFQEGRALTNCIYDLTMSGPSSHDYEMVRQMRRAALSIISNIAEGFERETNAEFIRGLYIAKESCGELRAQFVICHDRKYVSQKEFEDVAGRCRKVNAGISNLITYLKNSVRPRNRGR